MQEYSVETSTGIERRWKYVWVGGAAKHQTGGGACFVWGKCSTNELGSSRIEMFAYHEGLYNLFEEPNEKEVG